MTDENSTAAPSMRLAKTVRQQVVEQNEGLSFSRSYSDRNSSFTNRYSVVEGKILVERSGKVPFEGRFPYPAGELDEGSAEPRQEYPRSVESFCPFSSGTIQATVCRCGPSDARNAFAAAYLSANGSVRRPFSQ